MCDRSHLMAEQLSLTRAPRTAAEIEAYTIGGARLLNGPVHLADYDSAWPELFAREAARISQILGTVAKRIEHVGSTSVPGLAAKPIIDIVMEVADSSDESSYVAPLEAHGYQLRVREPKWHEHRVLKGPDTDINLHVFASGCIEFPRMTRFRDHLRTNATDRALYETTKRELARRDWAFIQNYADAKTEIIEEIITRMGGGAD
jgi:GrpB-like predicted nucleotidyltransferase (UPF0157 family)